MSHIEGLTPGQKFVDYAFGKGALILTPGGRRLDCKRISPYFLDSRLFYTDESVDDYLSYTCTSAINVRFGNEVDVVFGSARLSGAIAMKLLHLTRRNIGCANIKDCDGLANKRVVIVDDIVTDDASLHKAVKTILAKGGNPIGCVIVFDRQERGYDPVNKVDIPLSPVQSFKQMYKIPIIAAAKLSDLVFLLEMVKNKAYDLGVTTSLNMVRAYRQEYGEIDLIQRGYR
jgi:orotate phosphoribosyltransferase